MEITCVKIRRIYNSGAVRAVASIVIDGELAVHELKIIEGRGRVFVGMPSVRKADGIYRDVVHPLGQGARELIESQVLSEYRRTLNELSKSAT